jgi:N-dimethylarginine dimethylaminohydrolase
MGSYGAEDRQKPLARVMMRAPGPAMAAADPAAWHYGTGFDPIAANEEHAALARLVAASGAEIHWIEAGDDGLADAVFVQDPSIVTRAGAVVLNMGKALRKDEADLHAAAYARLGVPVIGRLSGKATVEGGDCLWLDPQTLAVGRGARTNQAGIDDLTAILAPHGITVAAFDLPYGAGPDACLHLMSLISPVGPKAALVHAPLMPFALWADLEARGWELIVAPANEFVASNGLSLNVLMLSPGSVAMIEGYPGTRAALERAGCTVQVFPGQALCVACEGGPTCLTRPIWRN